MKRDFLVEVSVEVEAEVGVEVVVWQSCRCSLTFIRWRPDRYACSS